MLISGGVFWNLRKNPKLIRRRRRARRSNPNCIKFPMGVYPPFPSSKHGLVTYCNSLHLIPSPVQFLSLPITLHLLYFSKLRSKEYWRPQLYHSCPNTLLCRCCGYMQARQSHQVWEDRKLKTICHCLNFPTIPFQIFHLFQLAYHFSPRETSIPSDPAVTMRYLFWSGC